MAFEEEQARIAAGLSVAEYETLPGTPIWCLPGQRSKCHVLIWYRMSLRIPNVAQDAAVRKAERDSKMRRSSR